jgi:filamentous hemagglutinin family protein
MLDVKVKFLSFNPMLNAFVQSVRQIPVAIFSLLIWQFGQLSVAANPTGGTVAQGAATFNTSGSQFTVTTSGNTFINWQSFNIAAGQTTTFVEPSSSSVVWNNINDPNPSQILGNINANGYVVLQNQYGFYVGGQASLTTHGLVMTTASTPAPNFSSGGAWSFNAPAPTAQIINYGQIHITGGGSAFLIANDIENNGTISAPGGKIGLYAGEQVLVSSSPDGRGLSAKVTLPEGSVDNEGNLIADGGTIFAQARTVNQNGLIQANSVQNVNGTIELVASDAVSLGDNSVISVHGDNIGASSGGNVTIKSGNTFSDQVGSVIDISGGSHGGNGGQVEISALEMSSIESSINGQAAVGFTGGKLTIDPTDITLDATYEATLNTMIDNGLSQISLQADDNIEVSSLWNLADLTVSGLLTLTAGNNIILDPGAGIVAGNNWSVNLAAGTAFAPTATHPVPVSGSDGVYLNGGAYIQTQNGDISVSAANEVIIQDSDLDNTSVLTPSGAIRTLAGGNISVSTVYGDVNTGDNMQGFIFNLNTAPYYNVNAANLGGISTAAGGNVTITAGGNVISYLPTQFDYNTYGSVYDAGTGAFGPEAGNVTITAGGAVIGNYVLANGVGTITAGGNVGVPYGNTDEGFALSLIKGSWSVSAPNIYLDDVINPNGVFNDSQTRNGKAGEHLFNYDPNASVSLNAANAVEITGAQVPLLPADSTSGLSIPVLLPPSIDITTGAGGLTLDTDVILLPSPNGNVNITTLDGGNFQSYENPNDPQNVNTYSFQMSDSGKQQWSAAVGGPGNNDATEVFGYDDRAASPPELNNLNPVVINVSGSLNDVNLYTTKETQLTVGGNMYNSGFVGQNLRASDVTTVNVAGTISYPAIYTLTTLNQPIVGVNALNSSWDSIFSVLVDDTPGDANYVGNPVPIGDLSNNNALINLANSDRVTAFNQTTDNPGFVYNSATLQLGFAYQMSSSVRTALEGNLLYIKLNSFGVPEVQLGQASLGQDPSQYYFVTATANFVPTSVIETLYQGSQSAVQNPQSLSPGMQIGGPGKFNVTANSINLGASAGIVSWGGGNGGSGSPGGVNYASLDQLTANDGASVNVDVAGDLGMLTSTIATIGGGNVTVTSTGGEIDLGLADISFNPPTLGNLAFGIFTSADGNIDVTADGDINIDTARIATFNGGNVNVESLNGDVNAGNGVNEDLNILVYKYDPVTGLGINASIENPRPYGSGILALSPTAKYQIPGSSGQPGNISVETPNGNIVSTLGGISQFALDGSIAGGPTVTLTAGTPGVPATSVAGNIDLGQGGVLGGTVNLSAQGNIIGLIISRQNTTVTAVQNANITVLSGGNATANAGGTLTGDLIAAGGIDASGGEGITAAMFSSSVSANGGAAASTLGTATASSAAQSAANQSSADSKQQLARDDSDSNETKKKDEPSLKKVKRVTVILPKST